jgi:hypothetical protein
MTGGGQPEILVTVGCLALMALFVVAGLWCFRRIRDGRVDPLVNPSWTSDMRPASPPPPLRATTEKSTVQQFVGGRLYRGIHDRTHVRI